MGMYFWGTIAILFLLTCAIGFWLDRKRKGTVRGRAGEAMDARANADMIRHRDSGPGMG
jgi:hypothetical protein